MKKCCGNCKEDLTGKGWCERRNKPVSYVDVCNLHQYRYDSFAKRCMDLPFGFDNTLCEGFACGRRRKCIRYMLHIKKRLTATSGAAFYMVCEPRYNSELCYWPYYETMKQYEKQNV